MLRQNQRIIAFDGREYLGRELARAEGALRTGEAYVQDVAPEQCKAAIAARDVGLAECPRRSSSDRRSRRRI